jgi:hypothetical protein
MKFQSHLEQRHLFQNGSLAMIFKWAISLFSIIRHFMLLFQIKVISIGSVLTPDGPQYILLPINEKILINFLSGRA